MKAKQIALVTVLAGFFMGASQIQAHHGYAAYDMTETKSLKGIVTEFSMANPHSHISFDVKDANGNVEHWVVETGAPLRGMKAGGFDFDSLKPGDVITINFHPGKGTAKIGAMVNVQLPDGRVLPRRRGPDGDAPNN